MNQELTAINKQIKRYERIKEYCVDRSLRNRSNERMWMGLAQQAHRRELEKRFHYLMASNI